MTPDYKPKLIEVALPLAAINTAAAREKSIRQGHPAGIHLWWARRPLVAARAVIWASLVDDPSGDEQLSKAEQDAERQRLFRILEQLVRWENSNDSALLQQALAEVERCFPAGAPPVLDPFGGGGAIPLEAQRLGLKGLSGDLNPVAVLIQKSMVELPARFRDLPPVSSDADRSGLSSWSGVQGLSEDVLEYGDQLREAAKRAVGDLYPTMCRADGVELVPIAWIWARTVESPDPVWSGHVPLVSSWTLRKGKGKEVCWVEPVIDREAQAVSFRVREGGEPSHERTVVRGHATCLATGATISGEYIKEQGRLGKMGFALMAVAAEGDRGREYFEPNEVHKAAADVDLPSWLPAGQNPEKLTGGTVFVYGLDEWWKLFTPRQLTVLTTLVDCLQTIHAKVEADAAAAGLANDGVFFRDGGSGATAYADAVVTYLAFAIDKLADLGNSLVRWEPIAQCPRQLFGRQSIPMVWDFAEANPFSTSSGSFETCLSGTVKGLRGIGRVGKYEGTVAQREASSLVRSAAGAMISTDPPYYDNISYADLSDFFYVWLRKSLGSIWPDECATLVTPKADELIANAHRAGSKAAAERHFEEGMADFMSAVAESQDPSTPATIYYAYKATESTDRGVRSTGWDTFLQAILDSGLQITATWPLRTENASRLVAQGTNALASSVLLACRPRASSASMASTGEYLAALRSELPEAVRLLQSGNIAPVDIAQSTIGPGIKIFSRYAKVVEADGSAMSVSDALLHVNNVLGEILDGEDADLDRDSRFAVSWFTLHGYNPGPSGDADTQARSKGTTVGGVVEAGIAANPAGRVRLLERSELDPEWSPVDDDRLTVWEATQYLIASLDRSESEAAALLRQLGGYGERARSLAYVLFKKATDKGWAEEAAAYNGLITAWPSLIEDSAPVDDGQQRLV